MKAGHRICPGCVSNHENDLGSCFSPLIVSLVGDHHHHYHHYHQYLYHYYHQYHHHQFTIIMVSICCIFHDHHQSITKVTITWAFFAIGEIHLLVNLLRVFLVIKVCFIFVWNLVLFSINQNADPASNSNSDSRMKLTIFIEFTS